MVLDSSAIVSLFLREPGWEALRLKIEAASLVVVGAPTLVECHIVLTNRLADDVLLQLDGLLREMDVEIIPFREEHWRAAAEAFLRFGKGRHPAALNYGDCLSYAVAQNLGLPLLFKGDDFSQTDIVAA